jgi:SSS family solute:Na+ symporter
MTLIDWLIVVTLNGSIILFAVLHGRDTKTSSDWFLARRSLPWWIVGLSMYATAIDASDLVADNGGSYSFGICMFATSWVGIIVGWLFMSQFIALQMYRLGMYTNAEYLEARFGPATRILSALIQVLYRTVVMGIIGTTVFLTLKIVAGWTPMIAWTAVVSIAFVATLYTVIGGLRSVAITDAMQSLIMIAASLLLFMVVYSQVGGWSGIEEKLNHQEPHLADRVLRAGTTRVDVRSVDGLSDKAIGGIRKLGGTYDRANQTVTTQTPAWLLGIYFTIAGLAYSIVNHTQAMRMLGSRSEWDLKMSVVVAGGVMLVVTYLNLSMGIMGRALYDLSGASVDHVYPNIVRDFTSTGLRGIVVAGIIAASFSTYDSIGSTLSALLTRDVYGRLLVRDRDEAHYLKVGRWLTPLVIFGSFGYVPFLQNGGMLLFFLDILGAFVVPLLTIYLMGALTRVHRSSAIFGLLVGVLYGIVYLASDPIAENYGVAILVPPLSNKYAVGPISMLLTATTMILVSLVYGWEASAELRPMDQSGWLAESRLQVQSLVAEKESSTRLPMLLGCLVAATGIVLSFVVFW